MGWLLFAPAQFVFHRRNVGEGDAPQAWLRSLTALSSVVYTSTRSAGPKSQMLPHFDAFTSTPMAYADSRTCPDAQRTERALLGLVSRRIGVPALHCLAKPPAE